MQYQRMDRENTASVVCVTVAYLLCAIQTFGVNSILIGAIKTKSFEVFKHVWPAMVIAFTTKAV